MDNLMYSLNATIPIFLTMVLGMLLRKSGLLDEKMSNGLNKLVFKVALPAALFKDLATQDFYAVWDGRFVGFCFLVTVFSIAASVLASMFLKDHSLRGEFIQGSYRSSAAILGLAFIQNLYGTSGMAPLMIIASVPLYNICAVLVLSFFRPDRGRMDGALVKKTMIDVITNPILLGILIGLAWSLLRLPTPPILMKTVSNAGVLATPLGLMSMGASFEMEKALAGMRRVFAAAFLKLIGFTVAFMPLAIWLGFRESHLIAILVMLGSSTTVSSYVMVKNMGYEGTFTSSVVMVTTLGCSFTLTLWLFWLKAAGLV